MISIFTPTHDPRFLSRLASSIASQNHRDYEWIIVPNGEISPSMISELVDTSDARIRVVPYGGATANIGEIKRFSACSCDGDILVEVDHDDELTPDCLAEIAGAFREDIDFAYSNCAVVRDDRPQKYSDSNGWVYRSFRWKGIDLLETVAFDPGPASFSKIWYAPNHVRAWRRNFYHRIGGHDTSLAICDDHDLLCRTYVAGKIKHIDKCLYIYHLTGSNTCTGDQQPLIRETTLHIHDRHIYPMVERWCDLKGLRKIDICGGFDRPPGYESVDLNGADIAADLDGDWPFRDGEVGLVRAHDALEHLRDPIHTMSEIYRVLAPEGWALTLTPSTEGRGAWCDPTHVSYWNSWSFRYYTHGAQARYIDKPVKFQLSRISDFFPSESHRIHNLPYVKADLFKFDPDGRTCGPVEI